jgi:preprotein translocase subunit YajC
LILADFGCWLLAEGDGAAAPVGNPLGSLPFAVALIGLLYYFMILRPQRQRDTAHKGLLQNMKKNDRVVTIGGIYGVVVNVQRDQDEVTIKVDESNNTKLRVTFNAIARVVTDAEPSDKTEKT